MADILVDRAETEMPISLYVNYGGPLTGATIAVAIRDGDTDDSYLDFNDDTFKTLGWTMRQAALTESIIQDGLYTLSPGLDLTGITNLPAATFYMFAEYEISAPAGAVSVMSDTIYLIDDLKKN